jgi:serine protease DegS
MGICAVSYFNKKDTSQDNAFYQPEINSFNSAVEKASPAVVNIYTEKLKGPKNSKFLERQEFIFGPSNSENSSSLGSGVIFSSNGYILTNQHVIGDSPVNIIIELQDGTKAIAKTVGVDKETDLAVLKIEAEEADLPVIEIGNSDDLAIGDIVLAVGNPYGMGQSVSMGIISATGREFNNPYSNYLQTDAAINRGNSGGALINTAGSLVGINTMIRSSSGGSEGIGLAIPSVTVISIISDLIQFGEVKRGWLGFSIDRFELRSKNRLEIEQVAEGSPADIGGLNAGDSLLKINNSLATYDLLFKTFARLKPGDKISLTVQKKDEEEEKEYLIYAGTKN